MISSASSGTCGGHQLIGNLAARQKANSFSRSGSEVGPSWKARQPQAAYLAISGASQSLARQVEAAETHFRALLDGSAPSTRYEWKAWVGNNLAEIRQRMQERRERPRQLSIRLEARPDFAKC